VSAEPPSQGMSKVRIIGSGAGLLLSVLAASCSATRRAPLVLGIPPPGHDATEATRAVDASAEPTFGPALPEQQVDPDAGYRAEFYAREGAYLSVRGLWSSLGGDFDGDTMLQAGPPTGEVITIPETDDGYGYELALGWLSKGWAMELSYTDVTYDSSIGGVSTDVVYEALTFNAIHYLRANEPVQPYFMFGFIFSWADLEDAATVGPTTGDAELEYGFGIDGGLGLAWWLAHNLALDLRALFVYQEFEEADGLSVSGEIDDPIEGPSFGLSAGLTWVIGKTGGS